MTAGDDPMGISDDAAVVVKDVYVVLGRQECTDVAVEHEIRLDASLDRFDNLSDAMSSSVVSRTMGLPGRPYSPWR